MKDIFIKAKPVWGSGLVEEKNITLGLYKKITGQKGSAVLKVATSGFYKVFLNGEFIYYGPARCAHGFYRVDEIALELKESCNHIAIQVVNYFVNSFYQPRQKGFIQAELTVADNVLTATGVDNNDFELIRLNERVRKIQRYSYQRTFAECYNLTENYCSWYYGNFGTNTSGVEAVLTEKKVILPRNIPLNIFSRVQPDYKVGKGKVLAGQRPNIYKKDRSLIYINDPQRGNLQGFSENELDVHLSDEIQEFINEAFLGLKEQYNGISYFNSE